MQSPVKKEYITQMFGSNPANYAKFGLKGHNGIDFRAFLPNGGRCWDDGRSEIFAPHDGKIIENVYDAAGYGNYIKIESDTEASVLAHLSARPLLPVGSSIKMGSFIGFQGTTGNSTGLHLHWGYYKIPRNKQNGYNGYINQAGLYQPYTSGGSMANMYKGYDLANPESMKVAVDILVRLQNGELVEAEDYISLAKHNDTVTDLKNQLNECRTEQQNPVVDMKKWELNGMTVQTGNIVKNYKLK